MSFKELFNERFLSVVNEIDIHAESILIKLDETKNKNEIDEVNILRQKFISKCKEIENYNLETFSDKRKKLKFIMFIKNSSMLIDEKENKLNFVNELGYLVIFDQHLKYETIMQLKKILNENVEVVETQLDSFQELVKLRIFEDLIKKNSSDLFIDLCDPSKNIIDDIDLSSSNFGFNNYELDFLPKFINLDLVEALLFSNNQKKYLSSRPFSYFKNITNLTIEMCDCLQEISPYNFQSLDNLIQLIILNTGTKRINANAFNGLKNLQVLHLSENKIENIDVCAFNGLENLECLYLDQNRITKIQANNFASLIKLEHLFLDSNEIEELKSGCLNGLVDLKVLKISMNSSDCLDDSNVFSPLKSLQVLYLFDVNFSEINPNLFNELTNLKFLNVCRSNLFSIDINLQTLEVIDISETKLTKDEINSIRFDNLKLLTCSFKRVPKFGQNFKNLRALKIKKVTRFERECFQNVTNLNFLNIEFKYAEAIDSINENTLKYFSNFKYLEISNNSASQSDKEYYDTKNYLFLSLFNPGDQIRLETKLRNMFLKKVICVEECLCGNDYFAKFLNLAEIVLNHTESLEFF